VRVQEAAFDVAVEMAETTGTDTSIGGVAIFVGLVRDLDPDADAKKVSALTLEHYPGMTEQQLENIEAEALRRWPLAASRIVHRFGRMEPGEPIVLVICCSAHREPAFEACAFLMDWLKTKAPFWKVEDTDDGPRWVEARAGDDAAAERWIKKPGSKEAGSEKSEGKPPC
jgi:molybdopterin synthase catalytic subunit